jgi:hypothetical protein
MDGDLSFSVSKCWQTRQSGYYYRILQSLDNSNVFEVSVTYRNELTPLNVVTTFEDGLAQCHAHFASIAPPPEE